MYKYSKGFLPMNHQLNQDPIETVYKGYYSCPFFPLYGVNKEGDVIFLPTGKKEVYRKYSSHKEPVVIIKTNSGTKTVYRPRMIALTFIPVPKELKGKTLIEVNYKDGNEENLSLDNLEWAERGTWAKMRKWFENKRFRHCSQLLHPTATYFVLSSFIVGMLPLFFLFALYFLLSINFGK